MSDEVTAPASDVGQPAANPEGTTAAAPAPTPSGQAQPSATSSAPQEDTFFDPSALSEDLKPAYKQMQRAFTKRMQELAKQRDEAKTKVAAYDAFTQDPARTLQQLASQYGYTLTRAQAQRLADSQQQGQQQSQDWQPQTWGEVLDRATQMAESRILERLGPTLQTVRKQQAKTVESQLDEIDPMWRQYEDQMLTNLQDMPKLADRVDLLYEVSVPREVRDARATQAALAKLQKQASSAQPETKTQKPRTQPATKTAKTFEEAVEHAREQLASAGNRR